MELNILEIARRIRVREAYLATCIQSRFRGMQARRFLSEKLLERYKKERAEERSARVTGLTHPSAAGGWKMAAFKDSAYGYDEVSELVGALSARVKGVAAAERAEEEKGLARSDFVRQRQEAGGKPLEIYYQDEVGNRGSLYLGTSGSKKISELITSNIAIDPSIDPSIDLLTD